MGVSNARDQVGGAGPGRGETDPNLAAGPGIALSSVGGTLLVFGAHTAKTELRQHVEDLQVRPTRVAEQDVHPFRLQGFGQQLGAPECVGALPRLQVGERAAGDRAFALVGYVVVGSWHCLPCRIVVQYHSVGLSTTTGIVRAPARS